jgi:hypothetical protein
VGLLLGGRHAGLGRLDVGSADPPSSARPAASTDEARAVDVGVDVDDVEEKVSHR